MVSSTLSVHQTASANQLRSLGSGREEGAAPNGASTATQGKHVLSSPHSAVSSSAISSQPNAVVTGPAAASFSNAASMSVPAITPASIGGNAFSGTSAEAKSIQPSLRLSSGSNSGPVSSSSSSSTADGIDHDSLAEVPTGSALGTATLALPSSAAAPSVSFNLLTGPQSIAAMPVMSSEPRNSSGLADSAGFTDSAGLADSAGSAAQYAPEAANIALTALADSPSFGLGTGQASGALTGTTKAAVNIGLGGSFSAGPGSDRVGGMGVSLVSPSAAPAVTAPDLVFSGSQTASNGSASGFGMGLGVPDPTPRLSPQTSSTFNAQEAAPSAAPVVFGRDRSSRDIQETAAAENLGRDASKQEASKQEAANREAEAAKREQQAQAEKQQKDAARREQLSKVFEDTAARSSTEPSRSDTEDDARAKANAQREAQAMAREAMEVRQLEARQEEVHAHERAHAAVGGQYARSPNFEYEVGPDGKRYATGGEVSIDIAPVHGNARATINKMQQVYAAAMAPVNPSQADLMVAAEALRKINTAKESLVEERQAAMPDKEALAPLLGADNAIDELPAFETVTPTLAGASLDETGALVKDTQQDAVVEQISDRVRASLAQTISITEEDAEQTQAGESSSTAAVSATAGSTASSVDSNQDESTENPQSAKKAVDISLLGPPRAILAYLNAVEEESASEDDQRSSGVSLTV
ncbi:hypothetical protein MJ923_08520 [Shewanella sp. 3B26]|uniref:SprA-related family protein n=1 Tax=Shewanella zhuhaiensis TaxID=2919576 RepID=A0AAJ1FAR4_9GAMM|nr:putative metalloprotease CJM1_0395 family protein [Shewanella zhuhaiensis]MCH4294350.1 hypothetical protein [Shewanella zhuhaiensis]